MSKNLEKEVEIALVPEEETEKESAEMVEKKPNVFKRAWRGVKAGVRKVRESPAATIIGACAGAVATLGVTTYLNHRHAEYIEVAPLEPIEIEIETDDSEEEGIEEPAAEMIDEE